MQLFIALPDTMWKHRICALVLVAVLPAFAGCGTNDAAEADETASTAAEPADQSAAPLQSEGTRRMIAELDRMYEETLAAPLAYYYLNLEHAEMIREEASRRSGPMPEPMRLAYASELLNGGETSEAIDQIELLLSEADDAAARPTRERRALRKLLAIAYLRLGEQQNCIAHPTAESCIIPIRDEAVHRLPEPSRRAAEIYRQLLNRDRTDYSSLWLLNLAYMTLGQYPAGVPSDLLIPGLEPDPSPSIPHFPNVAGALGIDLNDLAGGVAIADFNDDGHLDIFATAYRLNDRLRLFVADGQGGFVDRSRQAGLTGLSGGLNILHADYNNDGFEDVLVLRGGWLGESGCHPNSLLKNNGDGTFQDVTAEAGMLSYHPTQTAAFRDFNNDGWLDLFIGNEESDSWLRAWQRASSDHPLEDKPHPSELYMSNGDGTFTEVAAEVGIDVEAFVKGVAWGDVNNDGLADLYVSIIGGPNRLFMNRGAGEPSGWQFEEVAAGVHEPFFSFPTWFFDYNNDGWEDLFVAGYDLRRINDAAGDVAREILGRPVETEMPRLFRNAGDGTFTNVTEGTGLKKVLFAMGSNYGDLDNDGYLDIYIGTGAPGLRSVIPNRMFRNLDGRRFEEVTLEGGFGHIQKGHAVAFGDLDQDGDQDIYASMGGVFSGDEYGNVLFENPGPPGDPAWVTLLLEGRRSNRSAIGARIKITVTDAGGNERAIYRTVSTGGSFGASSLQQEIGLGRTDRIDEIRITWPNSDRTVEVFSDLAVNTYFRIVEGSGQAVVVAKEPIPFQGGQRTEDRGLRTED